MRMINNNQLGEKKKNKSKSLLPCLNDLLSDDEYWFIHNLLLQMANDVQGKMKNFKKALAQRNDLKEYFKENCPPNAVNELK
jgi:hypothetical protein